MCVWGCKVYSQNPGYQRFLSQILAITILMSRAIEMQQCRVVKPLFLFVVAEDMKCRQKLNSPYFSFTHDKRVTMHATFADTH